MKGPGASPAPISPCWGEGDGGRGGLRFGELIGYGLRLISGYLADQTGRYWAVTIQF